MTCSAFVFRRLILAALGGWFFFGATVRAAEPLQVVTLHTVLAEIAREVGGNDVRVTTLVRPGVDPHTYDPTVVDIVAVTKADLVLAAGLNLEHYLERIATNAGGHARLIKIGDAMPEVLALRNDDENESGLDSQRLLLDSAREPDPHWWHSIDNVLFATDLIRVEFSRMRPDRAGFFAENAQRYEQRLFALKAWSAKLVSSLPVERRVLVTSHDAFGYLAHEWGFSVYAVTGLSSEAEPSARHLATLIRLAKRQKVRSVFLEAIANPKMTEVLAGDVGAQIGGTLYADGLGDADSPAATYELMMKHNLVALVEGLR